MGERKIYFARVFYGCGPVTSCMHACSGSGKYVIPLSIVIWKSLSSGNCKKGPRKEYSKDILVQIGYLRKIGEGNKMY